jgi:hypothetical protein
MSVKVQVAELAEKVQKLERRLKKDEKRGVIDGEERTKREPSSYNTFISTHIGEMTGKDPQTRFRQVVELWHKEHDEKKHKAEGKRKEE